MTLRHGMAATLIIGCVAMGCQTMPTVSSPNTFAVPGTGQLMTTVQVSLDPTRNYRVQQIAAPVPVSDVAALSVALGLKPQPNATFAPLVTINRVPRANQGFRFTLNSLDYSTAYWLKVVALDAASAEVGRIPANDGFHEFTTNSQTASQLQQEINVTLKMDDVTYDGRAPVNVTFTPGTILRPSSSPSIILP